MRTTKFKASEIGPIPVEWEVRTIGEMACVCTGNSNTQDKVDTGKYPFYVRSPIVEHINEYAFDTEGVITVGDGVGTGKVFHYVNGKFALHQRCYLIDRFCPLLDGKYFYKIFSSRFYDRVMQMTAKSSVDSVRREMITGMLIPVPPLPEQRRIAEALSDADAWIESLDKLIEKKKLVKQGAMQALLSGKTRLPGFSGEWEERRLGEIGVFPTNTVPTDSVKLSEYIGTDNMLPDRAGVEKYEDVLPYKNVREYRMGDVLISNIRPYLKKIWLADRNGGCSTDVIVIRIRDKDVLIPEFLFSKLADASFFDFVMNNAIGTKMPRGDKRMMEMFRIPVPTLAEQRAIASVLSDMDAELAALSREKAKAEQIKQGMMQELLTGRVRVAEGE